MVYNEKLAERIRKILINQTKVEEKKMMGGLTFMVNGKMCAGIVVLRNYNQKLNFPN